LIQDAEVRLEMAILGLYDGHNAGAALVSEASGEVVAAVEEERYSRVKNHDGRPPDMPGPINSIRYCLAKSPEPVSGVALALAAPDDLHRQAVNEYLSSIRAGATARLECASVLGVPMDFYDLVQLPLRTQSRRVEKCMRTLADAGLALGAEQVHHIPHHLAHAACAYLAAPAPECLVVTLDGMGDGLSGMAALGAAGELRPMLEIGHRHSLGALYSAFTLACGYAPLRHEGKLTALAAQGDVDQELYDSLGRLFWFEEETGTLNGRLNDGLALGPYPHVVFEEQTARIRELIGPRTPETAAATVQRFVEDVVLDLVGHYRHRTGVGTLAVAGGLFANVSLNRRLAEAEFVDSMYVHPAMSDAGLAVGAALQSLAAQTRSKPPALTTAFLGPEFDEAAMAATIRATGFHLRRPPDIERCLARALALGEIVVRFDGRAEYGPRALGNRSILAPATDSALSEVLNKRLQRSTVMPFAPATLAEYADGLYRGLSDAAFSSEFMTVAFRCTPTMADQAPAAVHLDGTARPQVVHAERNPGLHAVLEHYAAMTGIPSVINTSLNLHEEPMVLSPDDALRCAVGARLSVAQIGPYLCGPDIDTLDRACGLGP
jgi:carbamoyltransferase